MPDPNLKFNKIDASPDISNGSAQENTEGPSMSPPTQMWSKGEDAKTNDGPQEYEVQSGETIGNLAIRFGVSEDELIASNKVHKFKTKSGKTVLGFQRGQKITIPATKTKTEALPAKKAESQTSSDDGKGIWSNIWEGLSGVGEQITETVSEAGEAISEGYSKLMEWASSSSKSSTEEDKKEDGLPDSEKKDQTEAIPKSPEVIIKALTGSVGKGGKNEKGDVMIVQQLLSSTWGYGNKVDGIVDDPTIQAIRKFQHRYAGVTKNQDSRVDPGGNTWKYLTGESKPAMAKSDDGVIGGAETDTEKKMAEFTNSMSNIKVDIGNGETVNVRPPYHINLGKRKTNSAAARKKAPKVYAIIKKLGFGGSVGKATPAQMKSFLEQAIKAGLVSDKSSQGLHNFMATYGVSTDCSGLAVQAANFLIQGDMDRKDKDSEVIPIMNTQSIQGQPKVKSPANLQAGDMMVNYKRGGTSTYHVRVITDVDVKGEGIQFSTLESGSSSSLGDGGNGVGQQRWEFPDAKSFSSLKRLVGNDWKAAGKSDRNYTYTRFKQLDEK